MVNQFLELFDKYAKPKKFSPGSLSAVSYTLCHLCNVIKIIFVSLIWNHIANKIELFRFQTNRYRMLCGFCAPLNKMWLLCSIYRLR